MKNGFFTALGTPLDAQGNFMPSSFKKQIEDQIDAGAAGLLVMGSMGIQPYIKQSEYAKVAQAGVEAAKGRCPVLVGVMDNSIYRVMDRIESLKGLKIDGVVTTTPFYYGVKQSDVINFFDQIAKNSSFPLYLYDLAVVTKTKIAASTVEALMKNKNVKGIKTGDLLTAKQLHFSPEKTDDFNIIFSGLDLFDVAWKYGIKKNLDGMFSCTAPIGSKMYKSLENEDYDTAKACLDDILLLRDTMAGLGIFEAFTCAMNFLGYEGSFGPDYGKPLAESDKAKVRDCMKKVGLI